MTPDQIFSIANLAALCCWLMLIVLPGRAWVNRLVAGVAVPAAFATLYTVIIALHFFRSDGGFSTLPDVARLFANPWLLLAGWIHYLAFDLLIGSWEARDSRERGVHHALVIPCLIATFMFGPAGWLLYFGVRTRGSQKI
jgi:membrane protein insertase Oxa1/YidC/SpoIIIJ